MTQRAALADHILNTGRPPTMAPKTMVVSPHALASEAGVATLRAGGNAIDAAIATSAALSVVYPHMTGIGGDAFWLIYDAKHQRVDYLNAAGKASRHASINWFGQRGHDDIPMRGILPATLTVPGAVDGWCTAHDKYGRLSLGRALESAISLARDGFPVSARLAAFIEKAANEGAFNESAASLFLPDGRLPKPGQVLLNACLAQSLERIASDGRNGFYAGPTAARLIDFARKQGGFFDEEDFAAQSSSWGQPISSTYRGVKIYETPPPTQGFAVLEMLNILEAYDVASWECLGPEHIHMLVQAKQIAYHDRDTLLADPDFSNVPVETLISKAYADKRRALMSETHALQWDAVPSYGTLNGDTVYIGVVDDAGNAVSLIHSLYGVFGSGVVADGTGIVLQNRSAYFSLDPEHPNRLEAGKRPGHTLIASFAFKDDKLLHVVGCMGADGQPQIHLQTYVGLIDFGLNIQQAIELPRWLSGRFAIGEPRDLLNIETRFSEATLNELEVRGHMLNRWPHWYELAGHCHGITIDPVSAVRIGGADPRSDGAAIGY